MAVYVDPLVRRTPTREWRWRQSCHLFADTRVELDKFAVALGLKKSWVQYPERPARTHFDLTGNKRMLALKLGAVEMPAPEAAAFMAAAEAVAEAAAQRKADLAQRKADRENKKKEREDASTLRAS